MKGAEKLFMKNKKDSIVDSTWRAGKETWKILAFSPY